MSRFTDWLFAKDAPNVYRRAVLIRSRTAMLMLPVMLVAGLVALIRYLVS